MTAVVELTPFPTEGSRITVARTIGGHSVSATAHDGLAGAIEALFDRISALGGSLIGAELPLGWGAVYLVDSGDGLRVEAPDYRGRPRSVRTPDLTDSLWVAESQAGVLRAIGAASGIDVDFSALLYYRESAMSGAAVGLFRQQLPEGPFSGLIIDAYPPPDAAPQTDDLLSSRLHALFRLRPALIPALALPVGYRAVVDGSTLTVLDETGRAVFDATTVPDARADERTPMTELPDQDELVAIATAYFGALSDDTTELVVKPIPEDDAVCVYQPVRGGGSIFVARDGSALFVGSSLDFDRGLAEFRNGRRTPPEKFQRPAR